LRALICLWLQRANKATMAWGVEARVPFLDKGFLDYAMGLDPVHKLCGKLAPDQRIEKWALRKAFDTPDDPYLPEEVLWRQKEQFSDGVGYDWIDVSAHTNAQAFHPPLGDCAIGESDEAWQVLYVWLW
jgi:asparagine synthase (glutamine-hydrolysing)